MKNVIIIIGTIILGIFIVNNLVLGSGDSSLKTAAEKVAAHGTTEITSSFDKVTLPTS